MVGGGGRAGRSGAREGCTARAARAALTADVCVGRQAVAEQLHVPSGGIHAALGGGQRPCQPVRSAKLDPSPQPRADPDPASSSGQLFCLSCSSGSTLERAAVDLGPFWGGSLPWARTPLQPGIRGVGLRRLCPLRGPQMRPSFAIPGAEWRGETRVPSPLPGGLRGGEPLPSPIPSAPRGPTGQEAWAHSPSAPGFPAARPARPAAAYTRGRAAPAPSGPARPARPARLPGRGSAGRTRADGPAGGKFPPRKEEGRGGAGLGRGRRRGKGPGGEGERSGRPRGGGARPAGRLLPHRKPLGRPGAGTRPQATTDNNNNEDEVLLGARRWAK